MKISILSVDLSNNCLGRAYLLGKVLSRNYDVAIHGFFNPQAQDEIWEPCNTGEFQYHAIARKGFPAFGKSMLEMCKHINGDVIYASKLRLPSFGVALLKKLTGGKPVVLDIDDLETSWFEHLKGIQRLRTIAQPTGALWTHWMEHLVHFADEITTVSTQFQKKYGRGTIVPHGKDTDTFDPDKYNKNELRERLHINSFKTIMFLGTAVPHKGLEDILEAINMLKRDDIRLMIVGAGLHPAYENMLKELGKDKVILKEKIPFHAIPEHLHAADLVILPQKNTIQAYGQIPAKIFDAMAMAKPIIATNVSDLALILDGCGIIVDPGDVPALAEKIEWVFSNPDDAEKMGKRAREKCIKQYSWDVMEDKLTAIFDQYK